MRPLGISCYEDKLVENAIAQILIPIYEQKFIAASYGFRPNRNCHMAVREVIEMVQYRKTTAAIKSFYTQTEWLLYKWLNRRSQKKSYSKTAFFEGLLNIFKLPESKIYVSLFYRQDLI